MPLADCAGKKAFLDVCRKYSKQTELVVESILPEVGENTLTLQGKFYIDNVSSTRLQNGRAQNVLTVNQLNESLVRGLARAWQLKKLLEKA